MAKMTREELLQKPTDYKPYENLVYQTAKALHRRLYAAGITTIQFEDVLSEAWETWCKCRDSFDPNKNFQFDTYYSRAAHYNFGLLIDRNTDKVLMKADSTKLFNNDNEDDLVDALDTCVDDGLDPEEHLSRKQQLSVENMANGVPLLSMFVDLIKNPPEELKEELEAAKAQTDYYKSITGLHRNKPNAFNLQMLINTFGLDWRHRKKLTEEIEKVMENV